MPNTCPLPELLSPAGSWESLVAAVQAGADAVFLGFGDFNARRNAKNFSAEEFAEAVRYYTEREPRGEYVLVLEGAPENADSTVSQMSIREHLEAYISDGVAMKDAIKAVAKERGIPKNEVYAESLKMKSE